MGYRKNREEDFDEIYPDYLEEDSFEDGYEIEDLDAEEIFDDDYETTEEYQDEIDRMRSRKRTGSRLTQNRTVQNRESISGRERINRGSRSSQTSAHSQTRGRRRKKKKGKIIGIIFLVIAILAGILFFQRWWKLRDGYWNIAVFGVDSRGGALEKGALSDVEIICSINKKTKEARLISVYRDTYLQIDEDGDYDKINEAYFLGGHEQAVDALERNLGIQIDDYATFNWKAVADAINLLGGIDLEITDAEFAYINSFITETVNSTGIGSYQLEHAGMNHLDGVQAVAYSRLRLMDTDFNRTERQRKVIGLALEKAKQADPEVLTTIILSVLPQLSTSIGAEDLIPIARDIKKYEIGMTAGFPFAKTTTRISGKDCVIPTTLESNVAALNYFLYDEEGYIVPASIKTISSHISEVSGIYEEGEIPGFVYERNTEENGQQTQSGNSAKETPAPTTAAAVQIPETPAPAETTAPESTEESTEETTEETTEESTEESEEESSETNEEPSAEGPTSSVTTPQSPGTSTGESEEGPGAGLPSPGESEENSPGIIHSGSDSSQTAPTNNIGPGVDNTPLYTGPGNQS